MGSLHVSACARASHKLGDIESEEEDTESLVLTAFAVFQHNFPRILKDLVPPDFCIHKTKVNQY